jgi:hypothetical protein
MEGCDKAGALHPHKAVAVQFLFYGFQRLTYTVVHEYPRHLVGTKICRHSSPLHKMAQYLHTTCAHPPIHFQSSLITCTT